MKISTKKHLLKKSINKKAYGVIDLLVISENKELTFVGSIVGDYDAISDFNGGKVLDAMEVLFDEKCE